MSNSLFLAVGFFGGTLVGIALMTLAAAGELRGSSAKAAARLRDRSDR